MEDIIVVMKEGNAIEIEDLSVQYTVFQKSGLLALIKAKTVEALKNLTFEVKKGESIAIIGRNGSGKTTLLKAIGGHLRPSSGKITTIGKVYTLSGANPGLIQDMSGRENVSLMSEIYGIERDKRAEFERAVEDFCELGEAYDRDLRTLSTGMAGRVGFGFTTSLDPEILLMDETLGVGDEIFRKKAEEKAKDFMKRGETILLSTHSLNLAKKMCSRGILLSEGKILMDGDVDKVVERYLNEN
ncbi:MAG: teichoic acid ABC transporter ATP-binding protein [Gammaproteobacteria bacterium]|nr:teichoic acid ABC transporter ATP-binding protein [Gammaproteobacteria bacterium]